MTYELDHLFICTAEEAPAACHLIEVGLTEGSRNVHPGQGTANRRFFFRNLMLELLWVHSAAEAQSAVTRPTRLWDRWRGRSQGTCPFGLCLRPAPGAAVEGPPFPTWPYRPAYLPPGTAIPVATNSARLTEPMLFYLPFGQRPDDRPAPQREPLTHATGWQTVTRVRLTLTQPQPPSPPLAALATAGLLQLQTGPAYLMELGFDGETQDDHRDLRPALPLVLHG